LDTTRLKAYFTGLQSRIVSELEAFDGQSFRTDSWDRPEGGGGLSRLIEEGHFFERGGVNFSHVTGKSLPASATAVRPQLAGRSGKRWASRWSCTRATRTARRRT
jgi:coproporphyrinogen III oxidase